MEEKVSNEEDQIEEYVIEDEKTIDLTERDAIRGFLDVIQHDNANGTIIFDEVEKLPTLNNVLGRTQTKSRILKFMENWKQLPDCLKSMIFI